MGWGEYEVNIGPASVSAGELASFPSFQETEATKPSWLTMIAGTAHWKCIVSEVKKERVVEVDGSVELGPTRRG